MAVIELYNHPVLLRYRASICTKGTIFIIIVFLLTIIPPFFLAYRSEGFWIREAFYREQPDVHFKHQILLVLYLNEGNSYIAWSTYPNFNLIEQNHLTIPVVKTREEDINRDGRNDKLYFSVEVPIPDSKNVQSVDMILVFDYRLYRFSTFHMESLAYIHHTSFASGAQFIAEGDLKLHLKQPLAHKGTDSRYNVPVVDSDSVFAADYTFSTIFNNYISRNATTSFVCDYPIWKTGRGAGQPFVIQGSVGYTEELIMYVPGFWQTIKMGWIQYLAVLIIFIFIMEKVKKFVFENQIITTIIERPIPTKNHVM
ncbi:hypothetical protein HOLleu_12293 [Holothuria leucospilota]|uniref:Transmembrane protein 231 n=1 Tax=Holothuria leucospilota TaxID=206669 RepID=A0A9Q1CB60_HOLLE|nr:hypothetical protein HOLleu_12293 [Holothuria leucospilota]